MDTSSFLPQDIELLSLVEIQALVELNCGVQAASEFSQFILTGAMPISNRDTLTAFFHERTDYTSEQIAKRLEN